MWSGQVLWKGAVFSLVMFLAKFILGPMVVFMDALWIRLFQPPVLSVNKDAETATMEQSQAIQSPQTFTTEVSLEPPPVSPLSNYSTLNPEKLSEGPKSLWKSFFSPVAVFFGMGLVARGEVCIMMIQLAHGYGNDGERKMIDTELFLVSMWAIIVCTVVGPLLMSLWVRRTWHKVIQDTRWGMNPVSLKKDVDSLESEVVIS